MQNRNSLSPWNPDTSVEITPKEYECQVLRWIESAHGSLENFEIKHLKHLQGHGGDYEFDVVAEFCIFGGARIIVIMECKRFGKPVERDRILALHAKIQDVSAHKGMIFSTSGFQRGALEYATAHGIATVTFVDGKSTYDTKAFGPSPGSPPWVRLPRFAGRIVRVESSRICSTLVSDDHLEALSSWLRTDDSSG